MKRTGRKKEWSIVLFTASLILFMPPALRIFNSSHLFFGIPVSYLSVFGLWGAIIALTAIGARRRRRGASAPGAKVRPAPFKEPG